MEPSSPRIPKQTRFFAALLAWASLLTLACHTPTNSDGDPGRPVSVGASQSRFETGSDGGHIVAAHVGGPKPSSTTELGFTFDSPESLARGFLQALRARNVPKLKQFALTEREFREFVWPQLPASQPQTNLPVEYAWAELNQKSLNSLAMTFSRYGGRRFELLGVRFGEETTDYDLFLVHRDSRVLVRDELGNVLSLAIFGSILETEGAYKLFSYRVD